MYKSKRQKNKSFDWYGLSQRFSIRKYHFGAASVLLGTALILGAAQTTAKAEEAATENKTEAVASAPKDDKESENVANVTTPALSATTEAAVAEKPTLSDEEVAKLAAEASKKDEKASETATTEKTEAADKEKATLTAPSTDKKADKAVDEKSDKKDEKKAENPITATKTVLEQLTSEAEVLNTTASNFADKKAEDKAGKEAIATAVAAAKVQIEASKKALAAGEITKQELDAQLQRISSAIEAVYAEMKRAGHVGKVEAVLAGETTTNTAIVAPTTKTPVKNINELTEEEIAAVKREIMNANPSITDPSMIEVVQKGNGTAGGATVTINGVKTNIPSGDTVVGTAGTKNLEQLKNNINWFDFAAASITYSNGTVVGPARKLAQPITKTITYPNGDRVEGKITMVRDVTYADGSKGLTTDDKFLNSGTAKYVEHLYYTGGAQNDHELYEALQEGMKFNVKTKVEGYTLTATVIKLGSKNVEADPNKTPAGPVNAVRDYGDWGSEKQLAKAQAEDKRFKENATKNKKTLANNPTVSVNGVALTIPEYPTETFANTDAYYAKAAAYHKAVQDYNKAIESQGLTATKLAETGFSYVNVNGKAVPSGSANLYKKIGDQRHADVLITSQDTQWSYLRKAGLPTTNPDGSEMLTAFTSSRDESNVGVTFSLSATYNGRIVDVNVIAADAEEAGRTEIVQFETDGTKWEQFMALNLQKDIDDKTAKGVYPSKESDVNADGRLAQAGYNPKDWVNLDEKGKPIAYGTNTFGANYTSMGSKNSLPIALSQNVKTLSMYLNSAGAQAGTIGFMIYDGGDAPQSYGSAQHIIGDFNKEVIKDGVKTQVTATQPYLGNVKGDPDFRSTKTDPSGGWVLDDLITSEKYKETPLESGKTIVTTDKGVTGKYLLLPNGNAVIEKSDNTRVLLNQGDVIEMANPVSKLPIRGVYNHTTGALGEGTLGDEGESQLLDPAVATEYKLRQAQGNEYVLEGVRANLGVNNDKAYIRGWVDFNNNGKFDLNESSEIVEVNQNGTYNIKFKNTPQLLDTSADSLGVRLRISLTKDEILEPTGVASSGEVEDFQTHVVHMPRGTRYETKDYQGREQTVTLSTNAMFIANGKNKDSKFTKWAQIENENLSPKIVLTDKQVASEEAIAGLPANYRVDSTGKVHVERNGATVYSGEYVTVKDKNNKVLGKGLKVTNPLTGKTEYLLSEYTEYDTAGNEVGTYKVNPANEGKNTSVGNGLYETTLTFKPNKSYVGTAKGIAVRAWDDNNNSTGWEANNDTIEASKISTTLAEKDKVLENTNNGNNGYKTMDTSYIPTVIDVRPIGEDTTTTDVQGKKQSARPQIPVYGTVETETGDKITDSRYADEFEIIDKNKSIKLADTLDSNKSSYDKDTEVSKATTLTLADGKVVTYTPDKDKLPARAKIAEDADVVVTGTGSVVVNNVRLVTGKTIPAGASPVDPHPVTADTVVTLANGTETTISAGGRIPAGAKLKNPLVTTANNTWNNVTYNTGDTIPRESGNKISTLAKETAISQIVGKGDVVKVDGKYRATNTIPAGTKVKRILPLNQVILPSATHLDPTTGAITEVPRSYDLANTNDSKVTITGEGVYELVKDASGKPTGEVTFTPEPGFVGRGTGVDLVQPDIDYNDVVANDKVTEKYGTDYGRAKYTPIVTPVTEASITRTIHYVYESDNDATATSQASYKNNDPILSINNEPVTRSQTLNYTRTYKMFDEDGVLDQPMVTANTVRDVNGTEYTAGTEIPKGTKFSQGTLIISDWKHGENNEEMNSIVSPTVKGYTANVVTLEYNAPNATGEMAHIKDTKEIGTYKPIDRNTKDVGTYKPASSAIRSDDKDNFDMYVVYKADIQKAKVTYIDLDATGDARILEVQTAATAPATGADAKTTYGVTTLQGKSHTKIPYLTADTIKKYEDLGYELVTDDYTNNTQGTAIEGGRKFDDDKDVDQAFNVYLRHKKVLRQIKDTQEVTRTIEYKYASTDDVPADKRGTTAAPTVTETLHFERDRTIDYTLAAKEYPAEYAAYKAVLDASRYDSPEEYKARTVYYDYITNKAIAADATAAQKAIVTFGPWTPVGGTATGVTLTPAEVAKDDKFNLVNSPEVTGYTPDNATVEATAAIDAEADDYKITVLYTPVAQKAVVKFVEVDPTNTDKVITPGLADPIAVTGKSEAAYPATTATSVTDKIAELVKKGYELVDNGFKSTDKFDKDAAVDQEYVVKFKAKVVDVPSFDPTKPSSNDNPKPTPGVTPIDPNNPDGPKWTEALINAVKVQEEVTRTIKYVYEDGTPVAESDLTSVADKKVKTLKFTRSGKINVATGEITYGDWSANQTFEAVTSPTLEKYTAAVAGVTPTVADVPAKTVAATDKDFEEVVVYKTKLITVDPKAPGYKEPKKDEPINPNDPNGPKWTDELLAKLKNTEEVTRTISYTYSTEASELNQAEKDGNKAGTNVADPFTTKVNYTRIAKVNPVTGEITYGEWEAKDNDTTLEGKAELPKVAGYVATGDVETSTKSVENVKAEDKDITEKVVYKALGKYVPVVPEGFTPPTIQDPQYPNNPDDPTKPGTPTTTIPYVPGTTPVGPDGQPLKPKVPGDPKQGYEPPAPTTPTGDTTIVYTKDGSQVAVTKFVDTTGKGLEPSVVDTGDTGKPFTKDADVTAAINKILARGYEKVANVNAGEKDYPSTDAEKVFDADASTNQEYTVTFKPIVKDIPTAPTTPGYVKPEPGQPVDPTKPDGPKWPDSVKDLKTTESVTRTIKYIYDDGTPVPDNKLGTDVVGKKVQTLEFTRTAKVNLVTGEVEYGTWTPKTTADFESVPTPTIDGYTSALVSNPTTSDVTAKTVTADAADFEEVVVYKTKQITIDPNDPNFDPEKPVDPSNPNGPKYKDLKLTEEVKRTITYTYADDVADTTKRGTDAEPKYETTVSFTRTATVNAVTKEITYSEWTAKDNDTTLEGKAVVPVKTGYVATGDVESSKKDVTGVNATDKDIIEEVIYKDLGKFVPVVPEGFTPPTIENPQYPNNPDDPTKPGTPTTTIPYVPGTTPVGPNGKPLTPKDPNDPTKGYNPPTPTNPTEDTTIVYTKDGSQVAVTHFIEVNSETDKTEKGGVAQSVVDTGDAGKAFTKAAEVEKTIEALKAKGYAVVENNYPTDGKFDADAKTNQVYKVLVTAKPITVNPNDPTPTKDQPIDPNNPTGPKWTPELIKELEDGRKEEVKRTIKYVYADGSKAADSVQETKEFKRSATINPVTGKITFGDWSPAQTFEAVTSPKVTNFTPDKETVPALEVTATAEDINETVIYTTKPTNVDPSKPVDPNTPDVTPKPEDKVPNDPKGRTYKELGLIEEVTHTVHYKLADGSDAGIPDNVQTLTFTRTADLDPVTGAVSNFSDWKAKGDDTTIDAITTPNKPGYVASAATSTARENVQATDKDSEETIIYRKLGSYVPVIPEGVTPPAGTDLTPKPYETPTNEDPTKPGTPTETPVVPYIPGTTPVGPDGKPLTPKDPNDPTKGYEVPKVPEDPTQNTTITYVKDGSQVALVHFIKADGTAVHVSVAEAGDTGKAIKTTNIDNVKAELEAKGYEVIAPTDAAYTTDRVAFYAESNRTFDDKDDKGNDGISQVYYVIVKEGITPIDPDKPLDPNTPDVTPKPGDKVPGDPKQRTYEQLGLLDEVNRTINYRYANTDKVEEAKRGQEAAATVEQKLRYSRKGDLNKVTGEITYTSDWTAPQTLAEVTSPVIEGYVADIKAAEKVDNVAHDAADSVVNVVYSPLGKYVPKVPEGFEVPNIDKPQYPNDPTDPTKPGTPTIPIPYVPGTTPKDPNGNPLKPVDPNDPSKGYVPPTPENPTEDTEITYEKDTQKAKVTYVVEGTGTVLHTDNLEGKSGEPIKYSTVAKLTELKALGYDLVTDGFTTATDKNYDKDTKVDQNFVVTVTPHVEPIKPVDPENPNDPNKPKPGDPIDPKNPDGPKWTEDLIKKIDTTRHVNRTITYVNEKGEEVAEKVTDKVTFTREANLNAVTGEITYGDWTAKDGDTTFDKVESPVVKGYILKDAKQKEVAATTGLTADSKDENIEVVYTKLGSWIPKVPKGSTPVPPVTYPNDPTDPTKPGTPTTPIPYVPGTTPKDPNGNPLKPVDPNDPSKGYVPPTPENPTEDTEITYEKDTQKAKVTYVVEGTGTVLHTDNLEGKSGEPIKYSTVAKLTELKALGYDLVTDGFTTATDKNYDKDTKVDQNFVVTVTPHVEPIKPVDPENPNDPNKPKPGDPIDPKNPDGPKWTEDLIKKIDTTRHVNRTITYVNEKGEEVAEKVTDKVTFTREANLNAVTGEITYGDWTAKDGDTTFDKVESPVVKGYILKDAKQKEVAATTGLTADSKDENIEVVYTKLGSWIPKVPKGSTPVPPVTYPNDPTDPTKPGTPTTTIPYVPGTTPVVPKDPTKPVDPNTNPLVPLTPVDPNDPTKGYEVPPVPTDPSVDTPITYVTDKQKAITNFVTETGKVVSTPVVDEGDSGANFTKSKVDEVAKTIEKLEKAGYRVVKNEFPSKDTDRVFDKDKSVDQIFTVTVAERIIPVTPGKPVDPNDPNLPKNPDGTPVTPSTPEPGKPVFPNDPNSPVWPSTVKDLVTEKSATRTIKYVDRNGKEVSETRTETIKFTREAKVNLVTGETTYAEWTTDRNDDIFNGYPVPVVKGYIAKAGDLASSTKDVRVTPDTIKDITETVIYDKLGSWIPNIPGTPTNPITYPNDPKDPTKPGSDKPKVPYVPGFIPVDPEGQPLKPVDPNDPTKGYEVPNVPNNPTTDTPISYVPVPQPTPTPDTPKYVDGQRELPNTGTEDHASLAALGLLGVLSGFGLIARKKREDEK